MSEKKLSKCDRLHRVYYVTKARQDNNVTNHIDLVYAEIEIELSRPIWPSVVCDENHIGQQHGRLYNCIILQNQYWTILIDRIKYSLW